MTWLPSWLLRVRGTRRLWQTALVALDAAAIAIATLVAYYARFEGFVPEAFGRNMVWVGVAAIVVYIALAAVFGLYRVVLRYVGVDTLLRTGAVMVIGFAVMMLGYVLIPPIDDMRVAPLGVLFIQAILVLFGMTAIRLAVRFAMHVRGTRSRTGRRVLIIGAGNAGSLLLREIQNRPDLGLHVVGFLDDDPAMQGRTIDGLSILGPAEDLRRLVSELRVDEVIVALPSASADKVRRVLNDAADAGVMTRVMPQLVIAKGSVSLRDLRKVEVEDLLGREPTPIDIAQVANTITGRTVAVTGAAGSIGSELCRQIALLAPRKLLLIEIDETRLYELFLELESAHPGVAAMSVCDIRDEAKLERVFAEHRPEVVLHAAAYKHVPVMETEPGEAVKTNVLGTMQVVRACEQHGTERFVLISTDKAVAPANMMGFTKALAEQVMLAEGCGTSLLACAVRFGNVLASRGSVVPIFEEQLRHGGPLTVTHPEVTRYFMTIPEAARLVLQAQAIGEPGDIFVLDMGEPVRIVDLARKMIALSGVPADIEFVGLRSGEKLHEALVHEHEELEPTPRAKILRVKSMPECGRVPEEAVTAVVAAADGPLEKLLSAMDEADEGFAARRAETGPKADNGGHAQ